MKKCCSCFKPTSSMHGSSDDSGPSALPVRPCSSPSALPSSGANRLTRRFWGRIIRVREERADPNIGRSFTFRELDTATGNFSQDNFLGQGGFGKVYRGRLSTGEVVAVKTLNSEGFQGVREFAVEVGMLTRLSHPHLVKLIGYCVDGDHRLVVYEYLPLGSLEDHLFDVPPDRQPLDWNTRMKIAAGAAVGLEYLHKTADPPVIYRDVKCSNVLLDHGFFPKLSDFGLARQGPTGDQTHVTTRVMGTYGYCAPEYVATSKLTFESDIYSFGILLLEIINGGRVNEDTRPARRRNLVEWARQLSTDPRGFPEMADPRLQGRFPVHGLVKVAAMALVCVSEQAKQRPKISEVVKTLTLLASQTYDTNRPDVGESSAAAEARMSGRRRGLDGRESPATASQAGDLDKSRGKRARYIDIGSNSSD